MSQKIRQDQIMQILKNESFVTVRYLVDVLQYSTATINRDLNALQLQQLVKRSRGGVELYEHPNFLPPPATREFYQKSEKQRIAKAAAECIHDGDTIFLAGTTTVLHMIPYLTKKKDLTVITNSARICLLLGETDFEVICLGGKVKLHPHALMSDLTVENAMRFHVDKMFFSTRCITEDGLVENNIAYLLYRVLFKNSKEIYLLADKTKVVDKIEYSLCDFSTLSGVITNFRFPDEVRKNYPDTKFICVE